MPEVERHQYSAVGMASDAAQFQMPWLPLILSYGTQAVSVSGLVDSGATVNVLPYKAGLDLGAVWNEQTGLLRLSGNLAGLPAIPLILSATVGDFPVVPLAFAWTRAENVPLILGQVNFFMEFDVCFYRSQQAFEVRPKNQPL